MWKHQNTTDQQTAAHLAFDTGPIENWVGHKGGFVHRVIPNTHHNRYQPGEGDAEENLRELIYRVATGESVEELEPQQQEYVNLRMENSQGVCLDRERQVKLDRISFEKHLLIAKKYGK